MSTIVEVIAWKFNNQAGMRCAPDVNGVMRIVEFPGGIPSQANQDTWTAEYDTYVSSGGKTGDEAANRIDGDKMLRTLFEVLYDLESRVRVLESRPSITKTVYRTALINTYKSL